MRLGLRFRVQGLGTQNEAPEGGGGLILALCRRHGSEDGIP